MSILDLPISRNYKCIISHENLLSTTSCITSNSKTTRRKWNSYCYLIQEVAKRIQSQMVPLLLLCLAIPLNSQTCIVITLAYKWPKLLERHIAKLNDVPKLMSPMLSDVIHFVFPKRHLLVNERIVNMHNTE